MIWLLLLPPLSYDSNYRLALPLFGFRLGIQPLFIGVPQRVDGFVGRFPLLYSYFLGTINMLLLLGSTYSEPNHSVRKVTSRTDNAS